MLTDHETRRDHDVGESPREHPTQMKFPVLDEPEPAWLEDDPDEEMEAPSDSPFRGMWIGITAAAVTFVLVFAIPQWLGWYDLGPPPQPKREGTPDSVISTVTARPSGSPAVETGPAAVPAATAPPAPAPPVAPRITAPREAKPPAPAVATAAPASAARRTYSVQIAAFKEAGAAGRLAARVKREGYPADVRRLSSAQVPWVVRVGTYPTREEAEAARDALARKGFRGFIL